MKSIVTIPDVSRWATVGMRAAVFTVELLLDAHAEAGVRDLWRRLAGAGLASLANHGHPTNRPHLTVATATSPPRLPPLPLPVTAQLGPVRMLGRALVRGVTPTAELQALHAWVHSQWNADLPSPDWVPHISLALKVPPEQREAALDLLATVSPETVRFDAARSYDSASRTVTGLR